MEMNYDITHALQQNKLFKRKIEISEFFGSEFSICHIGAHGKLGKLGKLGTVSEVSEDSEFSIWPCERDACKLCFTPDETKSNTVTATQDKIGPYHLC